MVYINMLITVVLTVLISVCVSYVCIIHHIKETSCDFDDLKRLLDNKKSIH